MAESLERAVEVFDQICDLPGPARHARLAELPPSLRAEVVRLLSGDSKADDRFERPPSLLLEPEAFLKAEGGGWLLPFSSATRPSLRYRKLRELGSGATGTVFEVYDQSLDRTVAMKVLRCPKEDGPVSRIAWRETASRFIDEARLQGQLGHPGIVPVYEVGIDEDAQPYFTMKTVDGTTLSEVFSAYERGAPNWTLGRVIEVLLRVCDAVAFAHARKILHRDLKPANVMVGDAGEVFVMDWGVARLRERISFSPLASALGQGPASLTTQTGTVVGTPHYMAPEQARGEASAPDVRIDVYSIGAMLYHLLAGHAPYSRQGETVSGAEIISRLAAGPPPPHDQERVVPELSAICRKAMARDPSRRYADVPCLAADLAAFVDGRVVTAYQVGAWPEALKWIRRNPLLATSIGLTILIAVLGLGTIGYVQAQGREAERVLRMRAEGETAKVLRLSDAKLLEELETEAESLWPPYPEKIPALESWLRRAQELANHLDGHQQALEEMRRESHLRTDILQLSGPSSAAARAGTRLLDSAASRWQLDVLAELVQNLSDFRTTLLGQNTTDLEHCWSVPKRLAFAMRLRAGFSPGGEYDRQWEAARAQIDRTYPGLRLKPQMGLIPLGPDPSSGLWEFAHLITGEPAKRGLDGKLILNENVGLILVLLKGGGFWMGSQRMNSAGQNYSPFAEGVEGPSTLLQLTEGPVHRVVVSTFFLSKYEMTQGQWKRLTGNNPSGFGPDAYWAPHMVRSEDSPSLLHPVERISWEDCMRWLPRAGLSLPSEAQWEYGARGGTQTPYWTGLNVASLQGAANVRDVYGKDNGNEEWTEWETAINDGSSVHAAVDSYDANPFGLHEIHGNVWEWCMDAYDGRFYAYGPERDPVSRFAGASNFVSRGGGFGHMANKAGCASRRFNPPDYTVHDLGVRPSLALR